MPKFNLSNYFKITKLNKLRHIFSLIITQDRSEKIIYIFQIVYIWKIHIYFSIEDC